ncbi:hypothetical protein Bca101_046564 [Brassica carinata]
MLFLPQFEDVAGSVGFFMKLYLPQYEDITLWCTSFLPKYEVIWTFAFVALVSIISGLPSWQWWSSSQLSDFIKHGFVVSVFVAVRISIELCIHSWLGFDFYDRILRYMRSVLSCMVRV